MSDIRKFYVELTNPANDTMVLEFNAYDTPIAIKWYEELQRIAALSDDHIKERDRFYNFPGDKWDEPTIIAKINEQITAINAYKPTIEMTAIVNGGQEHFNRLHAYFETMRGVVDQPAEFFMSAPPHIKDVIEAYNIAIHRLESHMRSSTRKKPLPRIAISVKNQKRIPMELADFDNFTLVTKFGEVYLNYCEVGKHLLEVCSDDGLDHIAGPGTIRPQRHYSASFLIKFFDADGVATETKFNNWFSVNETKLNSLGYYRDDKTLAIGYLPVAMIVNSLPEQELLNKIGKFDKVNRVYFDA